ncbi:MAG: hypothetical protein ACI8QZ_003984 [Chlamydiales bacterium]|jgi:hypothetical protein
MQRPQPVLALLSIDAFVFARRLSRLGWQLSFSFSAAGASVHAEALPLRGQPAGQIGAHQGMGRQPRITLSISAGRVKASPVKFQFIASQNEATYWARSLR